MSAGRRAALVAAAFTISLPSLPAFALSDGPDPLTSSLVVPAAPDAPAPPEAAAGTVGDRPADETLQVSPSTEAVSPSDLAGLPEMLENPVDGAYAGAQDFVSDPSHTMDSVLGGAGPQASAPSPSMDSPLLRILDCGCTDLDAAGGSDRIALALAWRAGHRDGRIVPGFGLALDAAVPRQGPRLAHPE